MTKQHLARWGGALALTVCLIRPVRAGECVPSGAELDVLTLNTWGLPTPVAWDRRGRMPDIAQLVTEDAPDVVGLQEVWRGALHLLDLDLVRPDLAGDSGLALVTPHPVLRRSATAYDEASGSDRLKRKGVLATQIDLPDAGPSWIVVTHLQASDSAEAAQIRADQVDTLLRATSDEQGPAVLMGDFNFYAGNAEDQRSAARLRDAGWVDSTDVAGGAEATYPGNGERFDRILVRASDSRCLAPERVEVLHPRTRLSDHQPVRASLRVGERAPE